MTRVLTKIDETIRDQKTKYSSLTSDEKAESPDTIVLHKTLSPITLITFHDALLSFKYKNIETKRNTVELARFLLLGWIGNCLLFHTAMTKNENIGWQGKMQWTEITDEQRKQLLAISFADVSDIVGFPRESVPENILNEPYDKWNDETLETALNLIYIACLVWTRIRNEEQHAADELYEERIKAFMLPNKKELSMDEFVSMAKEYSRERCADVFVASVLNGVDIEDVFA